MNPEITVITLPGITLIFESHKHNLRNWAVKPFCLGEWKFSCVNPCGTKKLQTWERIICCTMGYLWFHTKWGIDKLSLIRQNRVKVLEELAREYGIFLAKKDEIMNEEK